MKSRGLYLVGGSAYALRTYLLCLYDNAGTETPEDTFNYFLCCRIYVECCFGKVDRRWGILWGPLQGKLSKKKYVIDACLRLHNFIIDEQESNTCHHEEDFTEETSERFWMKQGKNM